MQVIINNIEWKIIELSNDDRRLLSAHGVCNGYCYPALSEIYIDQNLPLDRKRRALMHELTHAFLSVHNLSQQETYTEEELAEFVALYGREIYQIMDAYFMV
jgi:Zn-dependent peptidase ImmA (M78 family)